MTQPDFLASLEQELQLRGRAFSRSDLLAFVASVWPRGEEDPDVAFWARKFIERFNEGSAKLRKELNAQLAGDLRGQQLPPEQVERRRQTAKALGLRPNLPYIRGRAWTAEELAQLGTMPDGELAAQIGRTEKAVQARRIKRGIPSAEDRRRAGAKEGKP